MKRSPITSPIAIALLVGLLGSATAQPVDPAPPQNRPPDPLPWNQGKYGKNRVTHLAITLSLGAAYALGETVFKDRISPDDCRWCTPPSFDRSVRDALVWDNPNRANLYSNLTAYVAAPIVGLGLLVLSERDASSARLIDDTLPVLETVAISQIITNAIKIGFARRRPYATFATETLSPKAEDNLSFWSGHSALGFGITTSAGLIAHWRGYWTEPYIWGVGIALSVSTEYFRIAADKHYFSDVMVGGLVGIGSGLLIPRLMKRDLKIVPVANGAAIAGAF